jgi:pimeloyl-ACP methyl ester carboxylesterase
MRTVSPFGDLTPAQWRHLALHVARRDDDGRWRFRYDPGIAQTFKARPPEDVDMSAYWNAVRAPALVLRGEFSDLLLPGTLEEMRRRPHTETHVVRGAGHAPMLLDEPSASVIRRFLLG